MNIDLEKYDYYLYDGKVHQLAKPNWEKEVIKRWDTMIDWHNKSVKNRRWSTVWYGSDRVRYIKLCPKLTKKEIMMQALEEI